MVAIVAGNGLGLFNTSHSILGGAGVLGQSVLGQAGNRLLVNAASGNLLVQGVDEHLSGRGMNLRQLRTYNSLGTLSDGDGDGWQLDGERSVRLTQGALNQTGSEVTRTDGDGHETVYRWNGSRYVSTEGSGAHDTLAYDSGPRQWVWTEGSSRLIERYADSTSASMTGRLLRQTDVSGQSISYTYDAAGRLTEVADTGSGQKIVLVYGLVPQTSLTRLLRVETSTLGAAVRQVEYGYDTSGRLTSVRTDLTPQNTTDNRVYLTSYTYDGASTRIASITQSDGSTASFTYELIGGQHRIKTVTDANGTQSFSYDLANRRTDVTDANGQVWSYLYDAEQQLTEILSPAVNGARLSTKFAYDASGNLIRVTDARNNVVTYSYDANGNRILERDALGNTITRTFDGRNQLLTETRYRVPDPDGAGSQQPGEPLTTRYVYDAQSRLRFVISAEGRVSEYRYGTGTNDSGLVTHSLQYTANLYDVSALSTTQAPTEAQLTAWVGSLSDKSKVQLTQFAYDVRGDVVKTTRYARIDANGAGILDAAATVIEHVYDAHGQLVQTIAVRGTARDQRTALTSYAYDGMGRLLTQIDGSGTQTTAYDDANRRIVITTQSGLTETRTFDTRGRLVSVSQSGSGSTRSSSYIYDETGRLRMVEDAQGNRRYSFYDAAGRLQFTVDSSGAVTGYEYDANGQMTKATRYAQRVSIGAGDPEVIPNAAQDRTSSYTYDAAGRLTTVTDAANVVSTTVYDGASRVTLKQSGDRVTRYLYDKDSRQIGSVDALGYLTEYKYDAGGRLVETVRYATRSPAASNNRSPLWVGVTNQTARASNPFEYRLPVVDADGDAVTVSAVGALPSWLTLDTGTAIPTLRGTPPATLTSYTVTLRASDGRGKTSDVTLTISVTNSAPQAPGWPAPPPVPSQNIPTASLGSAELSAWRPSNTSALRSYVYYDLQGRIGGSVDERGFVSQIVYDDADNRQESRQYSNAVTVAATDTLTSLILRAGSAQSSSREFDAQGRLQRSIAVDGTVTRYEYDGAGRLAREIRADGTNEQRASRIRYNAFGEIVGTLGGKGEALLAANPNDAAIDALLASHGVRHEYDSLGRKVRSTDANGNATLYFYDSESRLTHTVNAEREVTEVGYTVYGEVATTRRYATRMTAAHFAALTGGSAAQLNGLLPQIDAANDEVLTHEYDQRGLLTKSTDAEGFVTTNRYNGFGELAQQIRELLQDRTTTTQFDYDLRGALLSTTRDVGGINVHTRAEYDAFGRLVRSIDATGRAVTRSYENGGRAIVVTDPLGRSAYTEYDAFGRVVRTRDALDQETSYSYDDAARSVSVTTPGGITVTTRKTRHGETLDVTDGRGKTTSYAYDKDGQLTTVTDALGHAISTNVYDASGRLFQHVDARGTITQFSYDAVSRMLERRVDPAGANLRTTYEFDALGRQIEVVDGAGTSAARTTTYRYDRNSRLTQMIVDPLGLQLSTRFTFDGAGNTVKVERGTVTSPAQQVTLYLFDNLGRRVKEIAAPSSTTEYRYDAAGRLSRTIDAAGQSTWYVYDAVGQLTHTVNALGEVSESRYDANGRLIATRRYLNRLGGAVLGSQGDVIAAFTPPAARADDERVAFAYDEDGRLRFTLRAANGASWTIGESRYDAGGNVIESRRYDRFLSDARVNALDHAGSPGLGVEELTAELNALGYSESNAGTLANVDRARYAYDGNNRLRFSVDALGSVSEHVYDRAGNLLSTIRYAVRPALAAFDESAIDSAVESNRSNPANQIAHRIYDSAGRLKYGVQVLNAGTAAQHIVTKYEYDALGRTVRSTLYAATVPLQNYTEAALDAAANAASTNADNRVTVFAYDVAGRQRFIARADTAGSWSVTENRFDAGGSVIETRRYDRRLSGATMSAAETTGPAGITEQELAAALLSLGYSDNDPATLAGIQRTFFAYDASNRLRFTVDALGSMTEHRYNALGQLIESISYAKPLGAVSRYDEPTLANAIAQLAGGMDRHSMTVHDAAGRVLYSVQRVAFEAGQSGYLVSRNEYDALGRVIKSTRYATAVVLSTFDLAAIEAAVGAGNAAQDRTSHFVYAASGELIYNVQALSAGRYQVSRQEYDALNRVVRSTTFAADVALSAFDEASVAAAVGAGDATQDRSSGFVYDAAGRMIYSVRVLTTGKHQVVRQEYDASGRVVKTTEYVRELGALVSLDKATLDAAVNAAADPNDRTTHLVYDSAGRVRFSMLSSDAGRWTVVERRYDVNGNVLEEGRYGRHLSSARVDAIAAGGITEQEVASELLALGIASSDVQRTRFAYDRQDRLRFTVDALGSVTENAYDALGQLVGRVRYATALTSAATTEAEIDAALIAERDNASNQVRRYVYDTAGRLRFLLQVSKPNVGSDGEHRVAEHRYNAFGQIVETRTYSTALGHVARYDEQTLAAVVVESDRDHRRLTVYDAGGRASYTLQRLSVEAGQSKYQLSKQTHDTLGQVIGSRAYAAAVTLSAVDAAAIEAAVGAGDAGKDRVSHFAYDAFGRATYSLQAVSPGRYRVSRQEYDALGQVLMTTAYADTVALAAFDEATVVGAVGTGDGSRDRVARFAYDAAGRRVYSVRALDTGKYQVVRQEHDAAGRVLRNIEYVREVGSLSRFDSAALDVAVSAVAGDNDRKTQFVYDAAGRQRFVLQTADSANWTVVENRYDAYGNLIEARRYNRYLATTRVGAIESNGIAEQEIASELLALGYDDNAPGTLVNVQHTRFAYDLQNRVRFTVDALGSVVENEYNALGQVNRTVRYAARVPLTAITEGAIEAALAAESNTVNNQAQRYVYDTAGQLRFTLQVMKPNVGAGGEHRVTEHSYDTLGLAVGRRVYAAVLGHVASYDEQTLIEAVTPLAGARDQRSVTVHDAAGRASYSLRAVSTDAGQTKYQVTKQTYDALGQVVRSTAYAAAVTLSAFDAATIDAAVGAGDASRDRVAHFTYDAAGRQSYSVQTLSSGQYQVSKQEYDALGQVTKTTSYADAVALSSFGAATIAAAVGAGNAAKDRLAHFVHDAAGRSVYSAQALSSGEYQLSKQEYDAVGRVVKSTQYVRAVSGLADFERDTLDAAVKVDAKDRVTQFAYDAAGRQRYVLQAKDAGTWTVLENRYDANGNLIERRAYDKYLSSERVSALETGGISEQEVADELSALGYQDATPATLANIQRTRFAHDLQNRLRFEVDALGGVRERSYDSFGQLQSTVAYASRPTLSAYDESTIHNAVNRTDADNQVQHYAYSAAGELRFTVKVAQRSVAPNQGEHLVTEHRYNALGQLAETRKYATAVGYLSNYDEQTIAAGIVANGHDRRVALVYDAGGRQIYSLSEVPTSSFNNAPPKYVVTRRDYDALGQLQQQTAYATLMTFGEFDEASVSGALVTNVNDRTTSFVHDAAGRQRFVVAADRSLSETVYDALGQVLETRRFADKLTVGAVRTEAALISFRSNRAVGDGVTRGEKHLYDAAGRLRHTTDALNNVEDFEYDALGQLKQRIDRNRYTWTYEYDSKGQRTKEITPPLRFRIGGELPGTTIPERSLETRFTFDAFGNVRCKVEAANLPNDSRTTDFSYDTLGRLTQTALHGYYDARTGRVERNEGTPADGRFRRTQEIGYDALGNQVRYTVRTGLDSYQHEYRTFNNLGQAEHEVNALGHVTGYSYTTFGETRTVTRYSVQVNGTPANASHWTPGEIELQLGSYETDDVTGELVFVPDRHARTVTMEYDSLGRKVSVTEPVARYYSTHNPGQSNYYRNNPSAASTVQDAAVTRYEYDAFGDLKLKQVRVNNVVEWQNTSYAYDAMGRRVGSVDAAGYVTAWLYDALGNLTRSEELSGTDSGTDRITEFGYNALDQQTGVDRYGLRYIDANGNVRGKAYWTWENGGHWVDADADVATRVRTSTYDAYGRALTTTDAAGNVTTREYDALGRVTKVIEPARLRASEGAQPGSVTDPFRNQTLGSPVTEMVMDAFGSVLELTRVAGTVQQRRILHGYDAAGNLIDRADAELNIREYSYDYAGRVIRERQDIDVDLGNLGGNDHGLDRRHDYDALGRRIATLELYEDAGEELQTGRSTAYNAFGEVIEERRVWGAVGVSSDSLKSARVARYSYDSAGHMVSKDAADGRTDYYYNLQGQVTREEKRGNGSTFDGTGTRITEMQHDVLGRVVMIRKPAFTADISVTVTPNVESVTPYVRRTLDRWGNMLSSEEGGYRVVNGQEVFVPTKLSRSYEYDDNNQLVTEHLGTHEVWSKNGVSSTRLVSRHLHRDLLGNVAQEIDESRDAQTDVVLSSRTRRKEYNNVGQLIAEIDATNRRTEYAYDIHGNRVGTRDANGTVRYDTHDRNGNIVASGVLRLWTGGAYNSHTGAGGDLRAVNLTQHKYDQAGRRYATLRHTADSLLGTDLGQWSYTLLDSRSYAIAQSNEMGVVKRCRYDQFGNKSHEIAHNGVVEQSWQAATADYIVGRVYEYATVERVYNTQFNDFGQVKSEANGRKLYSYHENGLLREIQLRPDTDTSSLGRVEKTSYDYDARSQVTRERRQVDANGVAVHFRGQSNFYDNQGRVVRSATSTTIPITQPQSEVSFAYDEFGNVRRIVGKYHTTPLATTQTRESWFTYDAEGRLTLSNGSLQSGAIVLKPGNTSVDSVGITYDKVGRRETSTQFLRTDSSAASGSWNTLRDELYGYDDLGHLEKIQQRVRHTNILKPGMARPPDLVGDWDLSATRSTNLRGDVTLAKQWKRIAGTLHTLNIDFEPVHETTTESHYRADGQLSSSSTTNHVDSTRNGGTFNSYDALTGRLKSYTSTTYNDQHIRHDATYDLRYVLKNGEYVVERIDNNADGMRTVKSYDELGRLKSERVDVSKTLYEERSYEHDARGQIILKDGRLQLRNGDGTLPNPANGLQSYAYVDGKLVALVGTGRFANSTKFDFAYTPISAANASPASYTVKRGDTLLGIAVAVYGDASLWYLIADANGISGSPSDPLPDYEAGKRYDIPSVARSRNSATTFKPYDPSEILGSDRPGAVAAPPPQRCSEEAVLLAQVAIVAIQAAMYFGLGAVGVPMPIVHGLSAGFGNLAGQVVSNEVTGEEGIDWGGVGIAALEGQILGSLSPAAGASFADRMGTAVVGGSVREMWAQTKTGFEDWKPGDADDLSLGSAVGSLLSGGIFGAIAERETLGRMAGSLSGSFFNIGMAAFNGAGALDALDARQFNFSSILEAAIPSILHPKSGMAFGSGTSQDLFRNTLTATASTLVSGVLAASYQALRERLRDDPTPARASGGPMSAEQIEQFDRYDAYLIRTEEVRGQAQWNAMMDKLGHFAQTAEDAARSVLGMRSRAEQAAIDNAELRQGRFGDRVQIAHGLHEFVEDHPLGGELESTLETTEREKLAADTGELTWEERRLRQGGLDRDVAGARAHRVEYERHAYAARAAAAADAAAERRSLERRNKEQQRQEAIADRDLTNVLEDDREFRAGRYAEARAQVTALTAAGHDVSSKVVRQAKAVAVDAYHRMRYSEVKYWPVDQDSLAFTADMMEEAGNKEGASLARSAREYDILARERLTALKSDPSLDDKDARSAVYWRNHYLQSLAEMPEEQRQKAEERAKQIAVHNKARTEQLEKARHIAQERSERLGTPYREEFYGQLWGIPVQRSLVNRIGRAIVEPVAVIADGFIEVFSSVTPIGRIIKLDEKITLSEYKANLEINRFMSREGYISESDASSNELKMVLGSAVSQALAAATLGSGTLLKLGVVGGQLGLGIASGASATDVAGGVIGGLIGGKMFSKGVQLGFRVPGKLNLRTELLASRRGLTPVEEVLNRQPLEAPGRSGPAVDFNTLPHPDMELAFPRHPVPETFSNLDDTARVALAVANPISILHNRELGGKIFETADGRYGFTTPVMGGSGSIVITDLAIPAGTKVVGDYHTHGAFKVPVRAADGSLRFDRAPPGIRVDAQADFSQSDNLKTFQFSEGGSRNYSAYLGAPDETFKVTRVKANGDVEASLPLSRSGGAIDVDQVLARHPAPRSGPIYRNMFPGDSAAGLSRFQLRHDAQNNTWTTVDGQGNVMPPVPYHPHAFVIQDGYVFSGGNHLAASQGRPITYGGTVFFDNQNKIDMWRNDSGHFRPSSQFFGVAQRYGFDERTFGSVRFGDINSPARRTQLPVWHED